VLVLWLRGWQLWVTLLLGCLLLGSAYVAGRRSISTMSRELRAIVDIMNQILEAPEQVPAEPYKQGELGELYTNLYKLVQALKESNRKEQEEKIFLRDIMSDISHQLKTPLASLTVFLDLLYDGRVPDVDKQKQMLLESKNQVSRMEWMVLSMLKLARIEAGAIQFEKHPCSLYAIVAQAKESVVYLTEKRGQQIDVQIDEKQMLVCDGDWLTEAIINLLKNASDYSGEQTTIHIWTEDNPMYTRIYVKDEGCGIAESELKNIFKRFYRINKEVNPNSVGIGLSLTKSIVEGMGGKISVRSELGCYTQFILTFVHT
jgi:signal transduction histidine kinase